MRIAPDDLLVWTIGLSPNALRVLLAIEGHCRTKPVCWPSNQTLAVAVGCKDRSVRECLAELERAGWIVRRMDAVKNNRFEIAMLRRLDPTLPSWSPEWEEQNRRRGRSDSARVGRSKSSAIIKTESEGRQKEQSIHSANANNFPSENVRSAVIGTPSCKPATRKKQPDRWRAHEMDQAIMEEAQTSGWADMRLVSASELVEPF
jgi:Helix-turn-helix domain